MLMRSLTIFAVRVTAGGAFVVASTKSRPTNVGSPRFSGKATLCGAASKLDGCVRRLRV